MREKQRAKHYYGLSERQFRRVFDRAARGEGVTGDELLRLLEHSPAASARTPARRDPGRGRPTADRGALLPLGPLSFPVHIIGVIEH
jgi:hypothetical protein